MKFGRESPRSSTYQKMERHEGEKSKVGEEDDVFSIPAKHASVEVLRKWRKAIIALNACRRFRYTANLKYGKPSGLYKLRVIVQVHTAAQRFRKFGLMGGEISKNVPPEGFEIALAVLVSLVGDRDIRMLEGLGGVTQIARRLRTDVAKGFPDEAQEVLRRGEAFGNNSYPKKDARNFFVFVWEACQDKTLIILVICAVLSLGFGIKTEGIKEGWLDGISIIIAVFLVILCTAVSDYRQSLQFMNLNEEKRNIQVHVVRGGRTKTVSIFDVVVGDIVPLNIGDQVPADGLLISGHSLSIDESSMTGETEPVHVSRKNPFLMSGCKVVDGHGTMLVTAVGLNTGWGLLMASISEENGGETPLQVRLNGVATFIGKLGLTVAVLVFIALCVRLFTGNAKDSEGRILFVPGQSGAGAALNGLVKIFAIAVTIVVVAVPEGLPLAVTLTLAYSMRKMMKDKALVRRLSACETMGSATTICSDKTGTLTLNQMTVVRAVIGGELNDPAENTERIPPLLLSLLKEGLANNTTGSVFMPSGRAGEVEIAGSPTEKAILSWAVKLGMDFDHERSKCSVLSVSTFNSEKKRGGVAALRKPATEVHIHWKGAAEIILKLCNTWIDLSGSVQDLSDGLKIHFENEIQKMAADSLRCIAVAHKYYEFERVPAEEEQLQRWQLPDDQLTLLAIVGIKDPCRPNVKEALSKCRAAGVKVRMVTGDNILTAQSIALECGILTDEPRVFPYVIEGRHFRVLDELQRMEIAEKITVMGRSSPNDKLLLVKALKEREHVVAVTGDGTNDAPALNEADIGLSMGIQGTEVAKESSDIVILDDDFSSVVKVVRWGRSVYANIQKFIQFQLTVNVAALVINFVAALSAGEVPLNAVQLLWVNLIMDTLGALALATEPPTDRLMERPPVGRKEPLVTNIMWRNLLGQALYQVAVLLTLQFRGKELMGLTKLGSGDAELLKNTIIFNAFVLCQIFNEFNSRKPDQLNIFKGLFQSRLFLGIILFTVLAQALIVEFAGKVASTTRLNREQWIICIVIGFISWPLALLIKEIPVPETPLADYLFQRYGRLVGAFNCCKSTRAQETEMRDLQIQHVGSQV